MYHELVIGIELLWVILAVIVLKSFDMSDKNRMKDSDNRMAAMLAEFGDSQHKQESVRGGGRNDNRNRYDRPHYYGNRNH